MGQPVAGGSGLLWASVLPLITLWAYWSTSPSESRASKAVFAVFFAGSSVGIAIGSARLALSMGEGDLLLPIGAWAIALGFLWFRGSKTGIAKFALGTEYRRAGRELQRIRRSRSR